MQMVPKRGARQTIPSDNGKRIDSHAVARQAIKPIGRNSGHSRKDHSGTNTEYRSAIAVGMAQYRVHSAAALSSTGRSLRAKASHNWRGLSVILCSMCHPRTVSCSRLVSTSIRASFEDLCPLGKTRTVRPCRQKPASIAHLSTQAHQ